MHKILFPLFVCFPILVQAVTEPPVSGVSEETSKILGEATKSIIEALKKEKIITYEYTQHKIELQQYEGAGAGWNLIVTLLDTSKKRKVLREVSCNTFYKTIEGKSVPDLDKLKCK